MARPPDSDRGRTTPRRGAARHGRHMSLVQVSSNFELDSVSNQQYSYGYDLWMVRSRPAPARL